MNCILFLFVFFFKQKTAYEMRISDWSSDVCSSDLSGKCSKSPTDCFNDTFAPRDHPRRTKGESGRDFVRMSERIDRARSSASKFADVIAPLDEVDFLYSPLDQNSAKFSLADRQIPGERTRVVWGQSVTVRVDLGGRRTI